MNTLLSVCYDGTAYHGSQVQQNGITVTEVLQNAIEAVYGQRLPIKGCSRTDAGVHANMFCVSFDPQKQMDVDKIPRALNYHLPGDIRVIQAVIVPEDFHPRYHSKGKEYVYLVHDSYTDDPFLSNRAYSYRFRIDENYLNEQAQAFVGTHDFLAFTGSKNTQENTTRTVSYFKVERKGDLVMFTVCADGFLYNMVRIMVGTLLGLCTGKVKHDIAHIIESKDRSLGGQTAPAHGLYLNRVFYDGISMAGRNILGGYSYDQYHGY